MTDEQGRQVLGRIDGDRFVPIADVDDERQQGGYVESDAIDLEVQRRMRTSDTLAASQRIDEQLGMVRHVVAAIPARELTFEQLDTLATIAGEMLELWRDGLRAAANGGRS